MKRFILFLAAFFSALFASAAYLRDIPVTVTQPDGTVLHCFASGDEFFNYLHDADGYTIMQHPVTGYYVYADKKDGKLVATDFVAGEYDPASKYLTPYNLISPEEWRAKRKAWEVPDKRQKNRDFSPNHGTLNNIAVFIRFSDDGEFTNTYSSIDNMFNDDSENAVSMKTYFRSASYGAIEIPTYFYPGHNGETIISYQDINPKSYFQPYNASTNPNGYNGDDERKNREFDLLERAVIYINENYPIPSDLNIDYDNDGYVDNVCFIVKGDVVGWSGLLWPHQWTLYDRTVYLNGKVVDNFNFQLADATSYFNTSTMCHEMNHSLGAPDLYHYVTDWKYISPVGRWDLMATNSTPPQHCGAYMKMKYGRWIDEIPEITQAGTYTLNPISSPTPENVAYKIATENPQQFYVLEYRDQNVETALYGSGLLIYRIDTRFSGNANYNPNEGIYDEVYIFRPDGTATTNGSIGSAHFNANHNRTEFSSTTNPYPFYSDGAVDNTFKIYDITSAGSTISFKYGSMALCEPPTNLAITTNGRDVTLTWEDADNAVSYNVYRDGILIGNTSSTSFNDNNLSYGSYNYFIRSKDAQNILSSSTETINTNILPTVSDLTASMSGNNAVLSWTVPQWCMPKTESAILTYGDGTIDNRLGYKGVANMYWGHRFLPSDLEEMSNKVIFRVSFYVYETGVYELNIYKGTTTHGSYDIPITLLTNKSFTTVQQGWFSIELDEPIAIDSSQDLWVLIYDPEAKYMPAEYSYFVEHNRGGYYSTNLNAWTYTEDGYAFLIRTYLTDDAYTYNLYDGNSPVALNIADTCYLEENITRNALHQYTVKTNFNGSETSPSNKAYLATGTHTLNNLNLETDRMNITEGSTLTVTGDLTCTNPDHLILEDGAQLIDDSEGVRATVKKAIQPYTEGERDGWNLIASPVIESLDAGNVSGLLRNEYDLYAFNQSGTDAQGNASEWRNYKAESFTTIDPKVGYLYANSGATTLSFVGTLADDAGATELAWNEDAYFAGFNLIGNPYPCNAYLDRSFYVLEYDDENNSTKFVLGENSIAPCTAVLVQAQTDEEVATFSKTAPSTSSKIAVRLNQADQKGATDIDQVRIMFQQQSQLAKYPQESLASTIYIPQNGKRLAVANAEGLTELPINLRTAKNGSYTLSIETEKLDLNYLHLIDNITGDDVDLLNTPSYTFNADVNDHEWRFRLVFSNCEDAVDYNEVFAYVSNGEIVINQEGTLQIVDMMGRVINSCSGRIQCVPTTGMTPGMYVLRLINGDDVKTQKIVIE